MVYEESGSETVCVWSQIQALQSFSFMSPEKLTNLTPKQVADGIEMAIHALKGTDDGQQTERSAMPPKYSGDVPRTAAENGGAREGVEHVHQESSADDSEQEDSLEVIKSRARVQIRDESWVERCRAATVLGQTSDGDMFAMRSLIHSLQDTHSAVRATAASALAFAHRLQTASCALDESVRGLLTAMNDDVVWVRLAVRDALVACTGGGKLSAPLISEVTSALAVVKPQLLRYRVDDSAAADLEVEKSTALIGFLHGKGIDSLPRTVRPRKQKLAHHSNSTSVHPYSFAGYQSRFPPRERAEACDPQDDLRQDLMARAAVDALRVLGGRDTSDQVVAVLLEGLQDRRWSVRCAAASAVGCIGPAATAVTALAGLLDDVDPSVRVAAATAIGNATCRPNLGHVAEVIVCATQELISALEDEEVWVRLAARAALVQCSDKGQWDQLVVGMVAALLSSKEDGVREAGSECLGQMAGCLGKLVDTREVTGESRRLLQRRGWVREVLIRQAKDEDADKEERAIASEELLVYLDARETTADRWQQIHIRRMDHPCNHVRRAAVAALFKLAVEAGQPDGRERQPSLSREEWIEGVIRRLELALEDSDQVVRESAVSGLANICIAESSSVTSSVLASLQRLIETDGCSRVAVRALWAWQQLSRGKSVDIETVGAIQQLSHRGESVVEVKRAARAVAAEVGGRVSTIVSRLKHQNWVEVLEGIQDLRRVASRRGLRCLEQAGLKDCSMSSTRLVLASPEDKMIAVEGRTADCVLDVIKYQLRLQISVSEMRSRAPFVGAGGVHITEEEVWKGLEREFACSIILFDGFSMLPVRLPSGFGYRVTMVVANGHAFSVDRDRWLQLLKRQATTHEAEELVIAGLGSLIGHSNQLVASTARRALSEIPRKGCPEAIELVACDAKLLLNSAAQALTATNQTDGARWDSVWSAFGAVAALSSPSSESCLEFLCLVLQSDVPAPLHIAACMLAGQLARAVHLQCDGGDGFERERDDEESLAAIRRQNREYVSWVQGVCSVWTDMKAVQECLYLLKQKTLGGESNDLAKSARWALEGFPSAKAQEQMKVHEDSTVQQEVHVLVKTAVRSAETGARLTLEEALATLHDRFNLSKEDALQTLNVLARSAQWDARAVKGLLGLAAERWPSLRRKALWILTDIALLWKEEQENSVGRDIAPTVQLETRKAATTKTGASSELLDMVVAGMVALLSWRDGSLVAHVAACLGRCANRGDDAVVTALVKLSKSDVGSAPHRTRVEGVEEVAVDVRVAMLESLGSVARESDERMRALSLEACAAKEQRVRIAAYDVVRTWAPVDNERVVAALVELATEGKHCAAARTEAAEALGEFGAHGDSRVLLALGGVLVNDVDASTRCAAARNIMRLRLEDDSQQVRVLQRAQANDAEEHVQQYIAKLLHDVQADSFEDVEATTAQECWEQWQASLASGQRQPASTGSLEGRLEMTRDHTVQTAGDATQHFHDESLDTDQRMDSPATRTAHPGRLGRETAGSSFSGTRSRSQAALMGVGREKVAGIGGRAVVLCPGESRSVKVDGRRLKLQGISSGSSNPGGERVVQDFSWTSSVRSNSGQEMLRRSNRVARPWISLEVPPTSSSAAELQDATTLYLFDSRVRKWRRLRFVVHDKNAVCQHESQQGRGFGEHKYLPLSSTSIVEVIMDGCFSRELGRDHCFILRDGKEDPGDPGLLFSCDDWTEGELFIQKLQAEGVHLVNPGCRQPTRRPTVARRSLSLMGKTMDVEEEATHGLSGNRDRLQRYVLKRVEATGIVR